jgi:hypothetical protein
MLGRPAATVITLATAFAMASCGEAKPRAVRVHEGAAAQCLEKAGAQIARTRADLGWFTQAREAGRAEHPQSIFIRRQTVDVMLWRNRPESASFRPSWLLWAAEPVSVAHARLPERVVDERSPEAFVAFVRSPSNEIRGRTTRCLQRAARE